MQSNAPRVPLWWLPLLAALLPLVATLVAFRLSVERGLIPDCNPFIDGCVSISRAARHELPNILFRALVLPAAVLQALCWVLCPAWLRSLDASRGRLVRALPWIGIGAAVALVAYGTFLGTDGAGYRFMRRYGVVFYFGLTCICMIAIADATRSARHDGVRRIARWLLALCASLPLLGLVHVLLPLGLAGSASRDAVQNVTEWWGGAVFTAFFVALALAWRASGFGAALMAEQADRPPR